MKQKRTIGKGEGMKEGVSRQRKGTRKKGAGKERKRKKGKEGREGERKRDGTLH